ncbi:MAG: FHA domain-containing protein [Lentisphaeria bacterium]|jgi:pSer/pThr/pTyr-binding forkhead associated (FHA) protein
MGANPKLVVLSEPLRGQSFELTAERYLIGRVESCEICIPDPTMSSRHCLLERQEDGSFLAIDQGSTNGSRINGAKISSQKLANSDILQCGSVEILYDSGLKLSTNTLGTKTGINLSASSGTESLSNMANFSPFGSRSGMGGKGGVAKYAFPVILSLLGVGVILALLILLKNLLAK